MLTVITGTPKIKNSRKSSPRDKIEDFCSFIGKYDPDFVFLPAYYVAKKTKEKNAEGKKLKDAFNEACKDLNLKRTGRGARILKIAEKIINSGNL